LRTLDTNGTNTQNKIFFTIEEDSVSEDSPPVTPLFATQPLVDEERILRQKRREETYFETHGHSGDTKGNGLRIYNFTMV
jgi:hypothetical protein